MSNYLSKFFAVNLDGEIGRTSHLLVRLLLMASASVLSLDSSTQLFKNLKRLATIKGWNLRQEKIAQNDFSCLEKAVIRASGS
jgi:hypothetical protein